MIRLITYSSLAGGANYIGFYVDLLMELVFAGAGLTIVAACASIYFGIALYINAMVSDMKMLMKSIDWDVISDTRRRLVQVEIWSIYVRNIEIHTEAIRY